MYCKKYSDTLCLSIYNLNGSSDSYHVEISHHMVMSKDCFLNLPITSLIGAKLLTYLDIVNSFQRATSGQKVPNLNQTSNL